MCNQAPSPKLVLLGPQARQALEPGTVQAWFQACGDDAPPLPPQWHGLLDSGEHAAAQELRQPQDRAAYVAAHALRRIALAQALDMPAAALRFGHEPGGRPLLLDAPDQPLYFSLSHCRAGALCAVTRIGPVGADIEALRLQHADFGLLQPFMVLPDAPQREADAGADPVRQFYFYWTAMEAYWKAMGVGIAETNPRIRCEKNHDGLFAIASEEFTQPPRLACVIPVIAHAACTAAVAIAR